MSRIREDLWTAIEIEEQVEKDLYFLGDIHRPDLYWQTCPPDILEQWVLNEENYAIIGELEELNLTVGVI